MHIKSTILCTTTDTLYYFASFISINYLLLSALDYYLSDASLTVDAAALSTQRQHMKV